MPIGCLPKTGSSGTFPAAQRTCPVHRAPESMRAAHGWCAAREFEVELKPPHHPRCGFDSRARIKVRPRGLRRQWWQQKDNKLKSQAKKNHTPQYRGCGFFAVLASLTNLGNRGEEFSSILGRSATPPIRNFPRFDYFGARRCVSGCVALGYATTSGQLSCGVDALRVGAGFSVRRLAPCRGLASAAAPASWCWGKAPATAKPRSAVAASRRRCAEPVRRSAGPRWLAVRPR